MDDGARAPLPAALAAGTRIEEVRVTGRSALLRRLFAHRALFLMMLPGLLYYLVFHYGPMYGVLIAFKEFAYRRGIMGSPWVGLAHFQQMFEGRTFKEVFTNTLVLGGAKLLLGFPIPILFALLLNEMVSLRYKKVVQTISYLPHFISWVILAGIFHHVFTLNGPVNALLGALGMERVIFLTDPQWFRVILIVTYIYKTFGWSSIIYVATITSIDPELYEAATVDGAGRLSRAVHITLPCMLPIMTVMLILATGNILQDDFDQIFNMYNEAVYSTADVLSTYTYRQGILSLNYSYAAAVELFKNVIGLGLVWGTNRVARKVSDYGIW